MQIKYELTKWTHEPSNRKGDNGIDVYLPYCLEYIRIKPGQIININLGLRFKLPKHVLLYGCNRSSLGKQGLNVLAPLIDSNYRGEIHAVIQNTTDKVQYLLGGDKIMQFVPIKQPNFGLKLVKNIKTNTNRGTGCFGSTNRLTK